jgi:hypothetical protein
MKTRWFAAASTAAMMIATTTVARAAQTLPNPSFGQETPIKVSQTDYPTPTPEATATATPAPAATATPTVTTGAASLKVGGTIFANYQYSLTEHAGNVNSFDVNRAYINIEPSWGDDFSARITPDITRQGNSTLGTNGSITSNTTGSLLYRLKYAYISNKTIKNLTLKVGAQQTPEIDFEESIWVYRVLQTMAIEQFFGAASSDFGYSAQYTNGPVDLHMGVFNGTGYTKPDTNKYKELDTRLTVRLFQPDKEPGLRATLYYSYDLTGPAQNSDRVRALGMLSFQNTPLTAGAQYIAGQQSAGGGAPQIKSSGASLFGYVNLPVSAPSCNIKTVRVLARVDLYDPNTDSAAKNDNQTRIVAGVAVKPNDKMMMVADYQSLKTDKPGAVATQALFLNWEAKF